MKRIAVLVPDIASHAPPVAYILYSAFSWLRKGSPAEAKEILLTFIVHQDVIRIPKLITKIFVDYFHDNQTVDPILYLLLDGYVGQKVIFTEDFPLTRVACQFIAGACVGIGENRPERGMKHAYSLLRLVHRRSLVLERDGEEWRMINGAMGLKDFWERMMNAGYDPREFSPIRHPDNPCFAIHAPGLLGTSRKISLP
jgi:hypothetical protein